jgi:hypothetical protein
MLAEKRIDLSLYSPEAASSSKTKVEDLVANEQNVRNRYWEVTYSDHIKQSASNSFLGNIHHLPIVNIGPTRKMKLGKKLASNTKPMQKSYKLHYKNVQPPYTNPMNPYIQKLAMQMKSKLNWINDLDPLWSLKLIRYPHSSMLHA